jgi:hypothetical protein
VLAPARGGQTDFGTPNEYTDTINFLSGLLKSLPANGDSGASQYRSKHVFLSESKKNAEKMEKLTTEMHSIAEITRAETVSMGIIT